LDRLPFTRHRLGYFIAKNVENPFVGLSAGLLLGLLLVPLSAISWGIGVALANIKK
jgi:hypothetical protein